MADEKSKPDIPKWDSYPTLVAMEFGEKMERLEEIKQTTAALEKEADDIKADIQASLIVAGKPKVAWGTVTAYICGGRSASKIDRNILAQNGVDPDVIKMATIPGKTYDYLRTDGMTKTKKDVAREEANEDVRDES